MFVTVVNSPLSVVVTWCMRLDVVHTTLYTFQQAVNLVGLFWAATALLALTMVWLNASRVLHRALLFSGQRWT